MAICGWCQNTGEMNGKRCVCTAPKRPHFVSKPKKKEYVIPTAHKHSFSFLDRAGHKEWFMCDCGQTKTIYVD